MGKRKGRRRKASLKSYGSANAGLPDPSYARNCCDGFNSDEGKTTVSGSSGDDDEEVIDAQADAIDSCANKEKMKMGSCCKRKNDEKMDESCSFKNKSNCNEKRAEIMKTDVKVVHISTNIDNFCDQTGSKPLNCCSSKQRATLNDPDVSAIDFQKKCCASRVVQASSSPYCYVSNRIAINANDRNICESNKTTSLSKCCSKAASIKADADDCCGNRNKVKTSKLYMSNSQTPSLGNCCSSPLMANQEPSNSGCYSIGAQDLSPPERSSSFLERLMEFRRDRGASLEKQRFQSTNLGPKTKSNESLEVLRLNISGMTCNGCCTRIEKFMSTQRGVTDVNVSLLTSRGVFCFDPQLVTAKTIEDTVASLGFEPSVLSSDDLVSVMLYFGQPERSIQAQKLALAISGVVRVKDVKNQKALGKALIVEYNPDLIGARRICNYLSQELGSAVQASTPRTPSVRASAEEMQRIAKHLLWSSLLSLPVILIEFVLPVLYPSSRTNLEDVGFFGSANRLSIKDAVELACATPVLFLIARPIHESAFLALRYGGRVTMDVLISLSACTAYAFSIFTVVSGAIAKSQPQDSQADQLTKLPEHSAQDDSLRKNTFFQVTVFLVTLILVGRFIETLVKARASNSVDSLLRMQAKTAILLEEGDEKELYIDVALVERGDLLKVLPGTRIPTDGVVVKGACVLDESMVTGEAHKVAKEPGDIVIGGSINFHGVLIMQVSHTIHESMLARMVRLVGEAQASRGLRQSVADAVAAYFTTFIIILAGLIFLVWYSLAMYGQVETQGWAPFPFALRFAITVLVISCPCAISLAVPTAIMIATTKGSQIGILFKGGRALEAFEEVNAVVFDKTGTLTSAQLEVSSVFTLQTSMTESQLWSFVAAVEKSSEHSIGRALLAHAITHLQGSQVDEAEIFEAIPGCGVHCTVRGVDVHLGSLVWLRQQTYAGSRTLNVPPEFILTNKRFQSEGSIVVFVVVDGELVSAIALRDTLRPEAKRVIEQVKRYGIQPWILTGDQRGTAKTVAATLGVPESSVLAECLPHQKVDKVRLLQSLGLRVAFVGDGVNDAPALATADVGVALGAGTDVALDAADVVLVKDDLRDLLNARALSNATNRRIKHNFAWGFMYNLLMMPIACGALYAPLGIWIPPALAGLSELLSSVPVILFSLLLNRWKPPFGGDWGLKQNHLTIDVIESTPLLSKHG